MRLWLVAALLLAGFALGLALLRRNQEPPVPPAPAESPPDWGSVVLGAPSGAEPFDAEAEKQAPAPAPVPAVPAPTPALAHEFELTVSPGQSLSTICKEHYGTASVALVDSLARFNGLKSPDALRSGQKLRLPPIETLQKP